MTKDPYYKRIHSLMHETMDRLISSAARCEAHADILMYDPEGGPDDATRLLQAQMSIGGGEDDIPHLHGAIQHLSALLVQEESRHIVLQTPHDHQDSTRKATRPRALRKGRGSTPPKGEDPDL